MVRVNDRFRVLPLNPNPLKSFILAANQNKFGFQQTFSEIWVEIEFFCFCLLISNNDQIKFSGVILIYKTRRCMYEITPDEAGLAVIRIGTFYPHGIVGMRFFLVISKKKLLQNCLFLFCHCDGEDGDQKHFYFSVEGAV